MGRYYGYGDKTELDGLLWIDTAKLREFGFLDGGFYAGSLSWTNRPSGNKNSISMSVSLFDQPHARVWYTVTSGYTGEKREYDYEIRLSSTPCNFGGRRWWLHCPLLKNGFGCNRRTRRLYQYGGYFGCRQCLNLCYPSQNESSRFRGYPFSVISDDTKADELWSTIKRPYYRGKPTRKMRRYLRLKGSDRQNMAAWMIFERTLLKRGRGV